MNNEFTNEEKVKMEAEKLNEQVDSLGNEQLPPAKIIVAGITGTGKSTLINAIFGEKLAKTGTGLPQTDKINVYKSKSVPIQIWDTVGIEIDPEKSERSIAEIKQVIADKCKSEDKFDRIHAIWYCINSNDDRYQPAEQKFVKELHSVGVPFIIVLTKCVKEIDEINKLEKEIRDINAKNGLSDIEVVQVLAENYGTRVGKVEAFGLEELVDITIKKLPEFIKGGFVAAQKVSKKLKREECEKTIYNYANLAITGFWDKVPFVNIFTTDSKVKKLFRDIGTLFNTTLSEKVVDKTIKELRGLDVENGFQGLVNPFNQKYNERLDAFFKEKGNSGFNVQFDKLNKNERVARILAFYGYVFVDAIEIIWDKSTEEQLNDIDYILDRLIGIIKRNFDLKSGSNDSTKK